MTPVLIGRLQTRVLLIATVGVLWTAAITPVLPRPDGVALSSAYRMTFEGLATVLVLGLGWELLYDKLQQLRWDRDWPSVFVLAAFFPESVLAWLVMHWLGFIPGTVAAASSAYRPMFAAHLGTTWLAMWLTLQGPLRVLAPRWRHSGGRLVGARAYRLYLGRKRGSKSSVREGPSRSSVRPRSSTGSRGGSLTQSPSPSPAMNVPVADPQSDT